MTTLPLDTTPRSRERLTGDEPVGADGRPGPPSTVLLEIGARLLERRVTVLEAPVDARLQRVLDPDLRLLLEVPPHRDPVERQRQVVGLELPPLAEVLRRGKVRFSAARYPPIRVADVTSAEVPLCALEWSERHGIEPARMACRPVAARPPIGILRHGGLDR